MCDVPGVRESEAETMELEQEDAVRQQKKLAQRLTDGDFALDSFVVADAEPASSDRVEKVV